MKRTVCLIMAFALCAAGVCAGAAEGTGPVDIQALSDGDLLALRDLLRSEAELRHLIEEPAAAADTYGQWYSSGLGQVLPDPAQVFGRETAQFIPNTGNSDTVFSDNVAGVSAGERSAYIEALKLYGFTENTEESEGVFRAENADGIHVKVSAFGNAMIVEAGSR